MPWNDGVPGVLVTFEYEDGEESRFFTLNYLDTEEASLPELKEYLLKTFFADQCMKLL